MTDYAPPTEGVNTPAPYYSDDLVTLYHGDCREITAWLEADVLVTDPPYGISHSSSHGASWQNTVIANDADLEAREWVLTDWGDRPALVFGTWKKPAPPNTATCLVWDKGLAFGMGDLSIPWKPNHEQIYVLGKGFTGNRDSGVLGGYSHVSWESKGRTHPHEKPMGLMQYLLSKCPPGVVADPFAGSGTTLAAAKQIGRAAIGVEFEERYCEIAAKRLAQDTLFGGAA